MISGRTWIMNAALLVCAVGCRPPAPPPVSTADLPPVYPRATITDPKVSEAAEEFTTWIGQQQADGNPIFGRIEVLPPVQTLEPYGIGTYQKVFRLPVILTTGAGWTALPADHREEITATAFNDLTDRLAKSKTEPALRPTVTIQTPQGLELAWVNNLTPGRRLLHGDGE